MGSSTTRRSSARSSRTEDVHSWDLENGQATRPVPTTPEPPFTSPKFRCYACYHGDFVSHGKELRCKGNDEKCK
ncbi:hypothetical protein V5799_010180 [Amblyomma americanum]|uniref:Uncharacterized protein n=1 Tax=Amblyomma americanum TaxID=6943 RepID=A0AAQ4F8D7_AMBAM